MISIPIWLFIILLLISGISIVIFVTLVIGYIIYCKRKDNAIRKEIERKYGSK